MSQITHDVLGSLPVIDPISICPPKIFQRSYWNTTRTEQDKSNIQPLDGLVADDDGWEEEDHWGTAHRSEHYDVHLHPPGPQRGLHGLWHWETEREEEGAGGESRKQNKSEK